MVAVNIYQKAATGCNHQKEETALYFKHRYNQQLLLRFISTKLITKYRGKNILCLHNKIYFVIIHQIIKCSSVVS